MKKISKNLLFFVLSYIATLGLQCRYCLVISDYTPKIINIMNRMIITHENVGFADIFIWIAVFLLLKKLDSMEKGIDKETVIFSYIMSVLLVICLSLKNNSSLIFIYGNLFQFLLASLSILGLSIPIYCISRLLFLSFGTWGIHENAPKFLEKHLGLLGFLSIFLIWTIWSLFNYPGTYMPDSTRQLSEFLGDSTLSAWQPPFSTLLMGTCFTLGSRIIDNNFGFYLYCLLQQLSGAAIFSYGARKMRKLGVPMEFCLGSILFFAILPIWGIHAQWLDKDMLYAEMCVLQILLMMEMIQTKAATIKQTILLLICSFLVCLLRNNGIYTIIPVLVLLGIYLKKAARFRIVLSTAALLIFYIATTHGIYPALGIQKGSIGEALSVPIQQTARYVCLYEAELTEEEKQIISENFHYDELFSYDPLVSDPVKNHFYAGNLKGYAIIWVKMFFKHPICYIEAFLGKGYGYLAPVEMGIETWVGEDFGSYLDEKGLFHPLPAPLRDSLRQLMFISEMWPISRLTYVPGFYSWILFFISFLLLRKRKFSYLILFVPAYMNLLICLASPLHNAMRYLLPTVFMIPYLVGWARLAENGE